MTAAGSSPFGVSMTHGASSRYGPDKARAVRNWPLGGRGHRNPVCVSTSTRCVLRTCRLGLSQTQHPRLRVLRYPLCACSHRTCRAQLHHSTRRRPHFLVVILHGLLFADHLCVSFLK